MHHNPELTEYNEFVQNFTEYMQNSMSRDSISTPDLVAGVIYEAATDGKETLRYRAGADAEQLLTAHKTMTDEEFFGMMKAQINL